MTIKSHKAGIELTCRECKQPIIKGDGCFKYTYTGGYYRSPPCYVCIECYDKFMNSQHKEGAHHIRENFLAGK